MEWRRLELIYGTTLVKLQAHFQTLCLVPWSQNYVLYLEVYFVPTVL